MDLALNNLQMSICHKTQTNILLEEQQLYYLTHRKEDKGVHTFPKGICPKVNLIARVEFELAYDSTVHRFNHNTTRTPAPRMHEKNKKTP